MNTFIEKAKQLIIDFCEKEYDCRPDFSNLEDVGLAYTETENGMHQITVTTDLIHKKLYYFVDSKLINTEEYSEKDMLCLFTYMSFDELICLDNFKL